MSESADDRDDAMFAGAEAAVTVYMAEAVVFVSPDATLRDAAREMLSSTVGALVLGEIDAVSGVLSERDIVRAVSEGHDLDRTTVGSFASRELVWCDLTATVGEVTTEMMERYVRHVLVEEGGHLKGIVSARDLLGAYSV
jgi:CBS domain-containing protein